MAVEFRSDAEVINGTAGTSVVVARPAGMEAGDVLVAVIAAVGTPSVSTPDGWTLLGVQDAATSVRAVAYYRVADGSEPASWTWTLGASQRSFGWVGAYTGVDLLAPVEFSAGAADTTAGTSWTTASASVSRQSVRVVTAVAAVRTASGVATTWTGFDTERADSSTNAGSGTDLAACVQDYEGVASSQANVFTSSQSCTAGALWAVTLRPAFTEYDGGTLRPIVEMAFGADPDGDPADWTWTDVTDRVTKAGVTIGKGLSPDSRQAVAPPTSVRFALLNTAAGDFTPDNPNGRYFPHVVEDVPVRVSVPYGYASPTQRALAWIESWTPAWDDTTGEGAVVQVQAYGRLQALQAADAPLMSVLKRTLLNPTTSVTPHAYWTCEDDAGSTSAASALPYQRPLVAVGDVTFGSASDCPSSAPLPTLSDGQSLHGPVMAAAPGRWSMVAVIRLPDTPVASTSLLLRGTGTGSAHRWWIELVPGTPHQFHIRAADADGVSLLDEWVDITDNRIYGRWVAISMVCTQNGANVDYAAQYYLADLKVGSGKIGTLSSRTCGALTSVWTSATSSTSGMAVGHIAVYTNPAPFDVTTWLHAVLPGHAGEVPYLRFSRLGGEAGIDTQVYGTSTVGPTMGPQPVSTLAQALEEAAVTDQGLIHDGGPDGGLVMVTRASRYNAVTAATFDVGRQELAPPLGPKFESRTRVGDSTASRSGGSSRRVVDPDVRSGRSDRVTLSLADDAYLDQVASWRMAVLNAPGMRYPGISLNLRKRPGLVRAWLDMRIGQRMQVSGLWPAHGQRTIDQHADGYIETITADRWDVTLHCYPASPYTVAVRDDATLARRDTAGSELSAAVTSTATSLPVLTTLGPRWSEDPAEYVTPMALRVGGERVDVSAVGPLVTATFATVAATGWAAANTGQTWSPAYGTATDYSQPDGTGWITLSAVDTLRGQVLDAGSPYVTYTVDLSLSVGSPTGGAVTLWVCTGWVDTNNHNIARLSVSTAGVMSLALLRRNGGTLTTVVGSVNGASNAASNWWRVEIAAEKSGRVVASMRNVSTGSPVTTVDSGVTSGWATGTGIAILARRETGNSNSPVTVKVDALSAVNPQVMTVTRGVAGIVKDHSAGTDVRLWTPARRAM